MNRTEREERNKKMREYKALGHTMKEVAEKFNLNTLTVQQICKGIAPCKSHKGVPSPNKGVLKPEHEVAKDIEKRALGFEYAGNYTGADGRVDLKCKTCGSIINRSMISVRHDNIRCDVCERKRLEQLRIEREAEKRAEQQAIVRQRAKRQLENSVQMRLVVCPICGKLFIASNQHKKYCSKKCRLKSSLAYSQGSDDRLNSKNVIDHDISLAGLYERDKGRCQLCGGECDYSDYRTDSKGTFIAGEHYPSIDHIVPLSMGGMHAWDNVRLAHKGCNTREFWKNQRS